MKIIKGLCVILFFYFIGMCVNYLIGGYIPGNIIGMILLFLSLYFKIVKPSIVKDISKTLARNMALFFIPAGVGLMTAYELIGQYLLSILIVTVFSTIAVIVVVAIVQEKLEERKK